MTPEQKLSSSTCNLRKAINLDPSSQFKLKEISKIISLSEINYNFKIQFTDFHPETKCQLVYVRIENKGSVKLSILEKLIFLMFIDSTNPILESCGMPLLETTEESEAVGLWGACREIFGLSVTLLQNFLVAYWTNNRGIIIKLFPQNYTFHAR